MKGKEKCKILREIRQKIAKDNEIELITKDCTYQGNCKGTCPKCEAEVRYLEQELEKRKQRGKTATVAALAATLALGAVGCVPRPLQGDVLATDITEGISVSETVEDATDIIGEIPAEETETEEAAQEPVEIIELMGDVAYIPESTEETADAN